MRRFLVWAASLVIMAVLPLVGCGGEPTAGGPTAEQLEIVKKNEPSAVPVSPEAKKIRPDSTAGTLGNP